MSPSACLSDSATESLPPDFIAVSLMANSANIRDLPVELMSATVGFVMEPTDYWVRSHV